MVFSEVLGKEVRIPERPQRIVSFSPAATETLFEIGLGEKVVGVSAFCARPREASSRRKVGSYNTVRPELLKELDPDLIFTVTGYQREFAGRISEEFPVYPLELPVSVAGIVDFVVKVGLVAGKPEDARRLSRTLLERLGRVPKGKQKTVYVELDLGGPVTFGEYSYITDGVSLVGSSSLFGREMKEWLVPDLSRVREADPDTIIYEPKMFTKFGPEDQKRMLTERGWEGLRAVKEGRFFVTPGPLDFLAHHGPSFITQAIPWLSDKLGGE